MTKEDKELSFKDLCARLPYDVKVCYENNTYYLNEINPACKEIMISVLIQDENRQWCAESVLIENIKPYLRPMSSMTEEELYELKTLCSIYIPTDSPTIGFEDYGIIVFTHHLTNNTYSFKLNIDIIDWLNSRHFDYRGLIERGLAIEVTKENNPYEK